MGLTGRAPVRTEDAYGTSLFTRRRRRLTGRASLRDGGAGRLLPGQRRRRLLTLITGGAYGTSHLTPWGTGRRRLRGEPPYGRRRLRDEPPYIRADPPCAEALTDEPPHPHGPEALTGRASLRRCLRDERPYGPEALTIQAGITSLYTGRPLTARLRFGAP